MRFTFKLVPITHKDKPQSGPTAPVKVLNYETMEKTLNEYGYNGFKFVAVLEGFILLMKES